MSAGAATHLEGRGRKFPFRAEELLCVASLLVIAVVFGAPVAMAANASAAPSVNIVERIGSGSVVAGVDAKLVCGGCPRTA